MAAPFGERERSKPREMRGGVKPCPGPGTRRTGTKRSITSEWRRRCTSWWADCPAACEKLRELGCPEGQPLEDGTTCEKFCKDTQESGHALRPSCVMNITACSQVNDCTKGSREIFE